MSRSKGYRKNQDLDPFLDQPDLKEPGFTIAPQSERMSLEKILGELSAVHRVLIDLAFIKGYTHDEIAAIKGIPVGTVKSRIRAGLHQLKLFCEMDAKRSDMIFTIA